ncbi:MAG: DUF1553 domain-containing protein, partial [Planctomycetales bacterium]|nr:DUF1553 domain-containing protein [Planctomycetales bacterium]
LDLIGLPPSPEQVEQFLSDGDDDAWESIIDRLLASPQYGERWGRHWLDVAGYADSEGASNDDPVRPWAYKYRDWVIRAIDNDMPFDQFITWQLAGDELAERPYKNMSPRQIDQLTATGFLRMAADGTASKNDEEARNQVVTDTLKIIGSSLLGASVHCAQCHDHRYDPISQLDYFRLRAIFEPAFDCVNWLPPTARRVSLYRDEDIAKSQAIEEEAQVKVQERNAKQEEYMGAALQKELDKFATPLREQLAQAYATASDQRTDEQNRLLEEHPNIGKLHPGVLYQYNQEAADKLKKLDEEIAAIRSKKPAEEFLRVLTEPGEATALPVTKLFYRGDFRQPRQAVRPGGIAVASPTESFFSIADNDPSLATSGRRLAFARWLTSGRHPILARVLVNRIWLHHFGRTFVSTPDEFGKLGTSPTHPELIDWLADEFMANGWSLKRLHRLIMSSTVYRQSSLASERAQASDAANELYSHFPTHRLDAEIIRDSILCVSGRLDDTMYGPPVAVTADDTGQIVIEGDRQRRSVYLQVRRTQPIALLQSFDAPVMETNCGKRECSTVATQSLMLMNSQFVMQFSRAFADRVAARPAPSEAAGGRNSDSGTPTHTTLVDDTVMSYAWQLAYARQPTEAELARSRNFVQQHLRLLQAKQVESPEQQALSDYCQSLIMSNEFLYMH